MVIEKPESLPEKSIIRCKWEFDRKEDGHLYSFGYGPPTTIDAPTCRKLL